MRSIPPSGVLELEQDCERFRAIASQRLDAELTRLEAARHADHGARCDECRAYAAELAAFTARIRATPAQRPLAPIAVGTARLMPARRRRLRPVAHVAVALAIVALTAAGLDDSRGHGLRQPAREAAYFESIDFERQLLRALRRPTGVRGTTKAV